MTSATEDADGWTHRLRARSHEYRGTEPPPDDAVKGHSERVEPWLAALLQAEHLSLLVGSGLTTATARQTNSPVISMSADGLTCQHHAAVLAAAKKSAEATGRGAPNIEDVIRSARELIQGLHVLSCGADAEDEFVKRARTLAGEWTGALDQMLMAFLHQVLATERGVRAGLEGDTVGARTARRLLGSFLLTFASRTATRERLNIFTTNYDRLIEFGSDLLGLRVIDRFVGGLEPVFRASRLGIDMHYNPPGIRGEPRYLEGVVRLTKLHGSINWRRKGKGGQNARIVRAAIPFGAADHHSELPASAFDGLMIYPNAAKDMETLEYPYAELFRDFAAAVCQPNAVLVTYGYGFGDDHVNRILRDMLTIPSTHLAILSFDAAAGRIPCFCESVGRDDQITLLIGSHFGDLATLVAHYLPKPAIDRTTWRMVELLNRRTPRAYSDDSSRQAAHPEEGAE